MAAVAAAALTANPHKVQALAIAVSIVLALIVFELVRRRRLIERYALVWLVSTAILLVLSVWRGGLEKLASLLGIAYPPNALFLGAGAFVLLTLLHFSVAISRLSDETKVLAQEVARLDQETRSVRRAGAAAENGSDAAPVATQQPALGG
jgi:hypothetical protein